MFKIRPVKEFHCTHQMNWNHFWIEVKELIQEIKSLNIKAGINELCDVYTCFVVIMYTQYGIDLGIIWHTSADEWERRIKVWHKIFDDAKLEFKVKYLVNGGNYDRPEKVKLAIDLAKMDQNIPKK